MNPIHEILFTYKFPTQSVNRRKGAISIPEILSRYIRKLFHCKKSSVSASSPSALHSVIPQNPVTECWLRCPLEEGKDLNCIPSPFSLCLDRIASYPISLKGENPMKKKWGIPQN
eukprot:TRINITY_DN6393_c0_g1_i2.p1 TRINITY_DN6393_c0_g1~~TRINITY_DN6393_c0_g1_i2.p1  ORF type:complete len:115 (-),score=10.38 TRINITY_DN6393_c0_g1_i2:174-518(-)